MHHYPPSRPRGPAGSPAASRRTPTRRRRPRRSKRNDERTFRNPGTNLSSSCEAAKRAHLSIRHALGLAAARRLRAWVFTARTASCRGGQGQCLGARQPGRGFQPYRNPALLDTWTRQVTVADFAAGTACLASGSISFRAFGTTRLSVCPATGSATWAITLNSLPGRSSPASSKVKRPPCSAGARSRAACAA